MINEVIR